jgi:hypothetical protein
MLPDAIHGLSARFGASLSHVASTFEWCYKVCALARSGGAAIDAVLMKQKFFRQWRPYLRQFYRKHPRTTTGEKYRLLDYHWANFGWGKDTNGVAVYHPQTMWLYKCDRDQAEWHTETPVKICFPLNYKVNGELPRRELALMEWLADKGQTVKPLAHADFDSYDAPIPLELAKQWDLRTLSVYLRNWMGQAQIDALYPEPTEQLEEDGSDSDASNSESDSE